MNESDYNWWHRWKFCVFQYIKVSNCFHGMMAETLTLNFIYFSKSCGEIRNWPNAVVSNKLFSALTSILFGAYPMEWVTEREVFLLSEITDKRGYINPVQKCSACTLTGRSHMVSKVTNDWYFQRSIFF